MKKLIFLSTLCTVLLFTSCKYQTISVYECECGEQLIKSSTDKFDIVANPNENQVYYVDQNNKMIISDSLILTKE